MPKPHAKRRRLSKPRRAVDKVISSAKAQTAALGDKLRTGEIGLPDWQKGMSQTLFSAHAATAAAAKGGLAKLSATDWEGVAARVKGQHKYLGSFAKDLSTGDQALDGTFDTRAGMYVEAIRGTFEDVRRDQEEEDGANWERRILGDAAHCSECEELAGMGWQPIGSLPGIGEDTPCMSNCACSFVYSESNKRPKKAAMFAFSPDEPRDASGRWSADARQQFKNARKMYSEERLRGWAKTRLGLELTGNKKEMAKQFEEHVAKGAPTKSNPVVDGPVDYASMTQPQRQDIANRLAKIPAEQMTYHEFRAMIDHSQKTADPLNKQLYRFIVLAPQEAPKESIPTRYQRLIRNAKARGLPTAEHRGLSSEVPHGVAEFAYDPDEARDERGRWAEGKIGDHLPQTVLGGKLRNTVVHLASKQKQHVTDTIGAFKDISQVYREHGPIKAFRTTVGKAANVAKHSYLEVEKRYGRKAAIVMAGAYVAIYASYFVQPRLMVIFPEPSIQLIAVAEGVRKGVQYGKRLKQLAGFALEEDTADFAEVTPELIQATRHFIMEVARASGEQPMPVNEAVIRRALERQEVSDDD